MEIIRTFCSHFESYWGDSVEQVIAIPDSITSLKDSIGVSNSQGQRDKEGTDIFIAANKNVTSATEIEIIRKFRTSFRECIPMKKLQTY